MLKNVLMLTALVSTCWAAALGAEEGATKCDSCRYVLVFDTGTKPSVALQNAKYELRCSACKVDEANKVSCKDCKEGQLCTPCTKAVQASAMLCDACLKKMYPHGEQSGKGVLGEKRNEAFVCTKCKKLCWREGGKQCEHEAKEDCEACKVIQQDLKALNDEKACPHCLAHARKMDTGTKVTAAQNIRTPCPSCKAAGTDKDGCKMCKAEDIKCSICKDAGKAAKEEKK